MRDYVAEPPQFRGPVTQSASALRSGLIALSLLMQRYEKATRTVALNFQIPDYNDGYLARQLD
jgi:hypothetical protein